MENFVEYDWKGGTEEGASTIEVAVYCNRLDFIQYLIERSGLTIPVSYCETSV